jgi:hypothetical protein
MPVYYSKDFMVLVNSELTTPADKSLQNISYDLGNQCVPYCVAVETELQPYHYVYTIYIQ